ncbi:phage tail assembly chaperone [Polycladidibacter stylochi]|uniref:phage tail assembly chaperone n=1 Tax=Polycladidibacter stylochi TaxID=1807766 RepID=UPI00082FD467|nr:phage tail assembly chaperone [Pseudovibrio stylochi]
MIQKLELPFERANTTANMQPQQLDYPLELAFVKMAALFGFAPQTIWSLTPKEVALLLKAAAQSHQARQEPPAMNCQVLEGLISKYPDT